MTDLRFHANGFVVIDVVPEGELQTGKRIAEDIQDLINVEQSEKGLRY